MKTKLILTLLSFSTIFISCKNDKKDEAADLEVPKANTFDVTVDMVVKKDDELILFYKDQSINYFDDKNTVYSGVKGSEVSQKVTFSIPEGVLPNDIRFDISSKKEQQPIKINSITLSFEGRQFIIDQMNFEKFFKANEYIQYDAATATATCTEKNGIYDPYFNTNPPIYFELEKLLGRPL